MTPHAAGGKFFVYGFGGIPKYLDQKDVSRLWSLNTNQEDPSCQGTMAVLQAYQAAIQGTELAGPSYFGPLLKRIKSEIVESIEDTGIENNKLYHLAIIITDGNCHDMAETKRQLVELSRMPFSAVVVGVGDGNFQDMQVLDADAEVLTDPEGNQAVRDIVQLVEYENFRELGMRELALEVLGEVPDQFVDYTVMMDSETENKKMYQGSGAPPRNKQNSFVTPIKME